MSGRWQPMLEEVARERHGRLVAHALLLTSSRPDAEDLVQDALVSVFVGRARFATAAEAEAYVRRAIVSRFIDGHRRRSKERQLLTQVAAVGQTTAAAPDGLPLDIQRALAGLGPRERACVVLRHVEDLSVRETASLLSLSEGAVKRYTSDGVARMNAALGTTVDDRPDVTVDVTRAEGGVR
jgi:RNA polymerase sigma factor (sigma-70 family)